MDKIQIKKSFAGWTFYPVICKDKKYVVDFVKQIVRIKCKKPIDDIIETYVLVNVYEFKEKKSFLGGHRGKNVFEHKIVSVPIDEQDIIDVYRIKEDELKIYLPHIMKIIFLAYERKMQKECEKRKKVEAAETWNGVVT